MTKTTSDWLKLAERERDELSVDLRAARERIRDLTVVRDDALMLGVVSTRGTTASSLLTFIGETVALAKADLKKEEALFAKGIR